MDTFQNMPFPTLSVIEGKFEGWLRIRDFQTIFFRFTKAIKYVSAVVHRVWNSPASFYKQNHVYLRNAARHRQAHCILNV